MKFIPTKLKGAYIIEVEKIEDSRGFFGRLWCKSEVSEMGLNTDLSQSNVSFNMRKGTLRGMHFQKKPFQETKLVRCTMGSIYDVIVDIRPESETFKQWIGVTLTSENHRMIYVPEGFAHGFITLEDNSEVYYLVTENYQKEFEGALRWDDPELNIKWPVTPTEISDKDMAHPDFNLKNIE
jgi:dTDP-4-dehydrorhamnose 3,5-epimerase